MATERDALREELRLVEDELETVRNAARQVRHEVGGRSDGAVDPEELASEITNVEEQEAVATLLKAKRDALRARLSEAST